jgi:hypothetical protein
MLMISRKVNYPFASEGVSLRSSLRGSFLGWSMNGLVEVGHLWDVGVFK